jgi:lipopolysaccharide export system permease protein
MIKKIDWFVFTSFIPPFVVAFMIAGFVLLMQTLWLYIDDIAGKGLGFLLVMELLGYKIVGLVPLAMPIAVLISSVMVMGNMAERYELSSFKSAGVPLFRVMRSLILFGVFAAWVSYFCSDYVIPKANLKFGSRMYDITKQKPALRLDAGVFNYDFQGYAIHIGEKEADGRGIKDVLIYDHSMQSQGQFSQISAKEGEMYPSEDGQYFIMRLRHGNQYMETRPQAAVGPQRDYPFVRTSFDQWTKVFDLSEFDLNRTDEEMFKHNRSMMSISQMKVAIDSIGRKIDNRETTYSNYVSGYYNFMELDSSVIREAARKEAEINEFVQEVQSASGDKKVTAPLPVRQRRRGGVPVEQLDVPLDSVNTLLLTFAESDRSRLLTKAKAFARSIKNRSTADQYFLADIKESRVKFVYDLHMKYGMAVVCFIFIFIGAPMGAIVRKGGFGYPILISIIFFMLFVVLMIFFRKIAESFLIPAALAAWVPCIVMFPIGIFLTYKAMNDEKLFNTDRITELFRRLFSKKKADSLKKSKALEQTL